MFSLDIRSTEDETLQVLEERLKDGFEKIVKGEEVDGVNDFEKGKGRGVRGRKCMVEWRLDADSPATRFHEDCIRCVEESAGDLLGVDVEAQGKVRRMTSGAGHDR